MILGLIGGFQDFERTGQNEGYTANFLYGMAQGIGCP